MIKSPFPFLSGRSTCSGVLDGTHCFHANLGPGGSYQLIHAVPIVISRDKARLPRLCIHVGWFRPLRLTAAKQAPRSGLLLLVCSAVLG